jgi:hypothetical protein
MDSVVPLLAFIVIEAGLTQIDGIVSTLAAASSTLSFHARFRGLGYDTCLFSSEK